MMLPILISVSLAPVSYFFCASAPLADAASTAMAAQKIASRLVGTNIMTSPLVISADRSLFLIESVPSCAALNIFQPRPATTSPLRHWSQRGLLPALALTVRTVGWAKAAGAATRGRPRARHRKHGRKMVGTAQERLCPPYERTASAA